ncbi:MAG: hypothetical protein V2A73_18445 [Pseudomonadota bacterium]
MALARTPLETAFLSEPALKILRAPTPLRLMAARGLAPLQRPADLACVVYQLAFDSDATVASAAGKTAAELPEKVILGALGDPTVDPRVLDFFSEKVPPAGQRIQAILLNRATADDTIQQLASRLGENELEIVAQNEQRLLAAPAIIAALYLNRNARMSTVSRVVELAVRNQVAVPQIPCWEELAATVLGSRGGVTSDPATDDASFAAVAVVAIGESQESEQKAQVLLEENTPAEVVEKSTKQIPIDKLSIPAKIRLATLGNSFARSILIRDSNKQVALAVIRSPAMTDNEVVKYSANRGLCDDVIGIISKTKEWTKIYQIKVNLVNNPKCPLPTAMRMIPFLHDRELRNLAKSKGVPSALAAVARKLVAQKRQ